METLKHPACTGRLGNATLLQLAFPGESNPNFPWGKSHWDNTVVKKATTTKKQLCHVDVADVKGKGKTVRWVDSVGQEDDPTFIPELPTEWECE